MNGEFVCFLEEPSAREMLSELIPKLTGIDKEYVRFIVFEGKQDLQKRIQRKLGDYDMPNCVFLVMCDKDHGSCKKLKRELLDKVEKSRKKKITKVRIACYELESFYLGDLQAVGDAFSLPSLSKMQDKKIYRLPDSHPKPSELLQEVTENKYQKVAGSRAIAPHLSLDSNKSKSFKILLSAITELHQILQNANS